MTSVAGHILERDFPDQYKNWQSIEPFGLFDVDAISVDNPHHNVYI